MPKTSARLLAMLSLLQARRDWPGALLAERLDVERPAIRPNARVDSDVLMTLSAAVHAREVLRFDYTRASASASISVSGPAVSAPGVGDDDPVATPPRRVQPHHLVTWGGNWYLVAWDLDRDDWRTFRADRITPRTPNGPRFTSRELPGGSVAAFVANRFQGSGRPEGFDGTGAWPCRGEVILDLPAAVVSRHTSEAIVEELGPDRCRLVVGSWSWPALAAALGRFDADIEVVGPAELKDAFAHLARRYAKAATGG